MLTRREKLLVRPWELRRYNNHRKKVLSAVPVVDFGPPPERGHVTLKLKKLQNESERRRKIEEENFRLLQRMGAIMKKNRLDNHWATKPPKFLRRVGVYHRTRSPSPQDEPSTPVNTPDTSKSRKSRCLACTAQPRPKPARKLWSSKEHSPKDPIPSKDSDNSALNVTEAIRNRLVLQDDTRLSVDYPIYVDVKFQTKKRL